MGDDALDDAFVRSLSAGLARTADGVVVTGPAITSVIRAHRADRRRSHRRRTGAIGAAAAIGAVAGTATLLGRGTGGPSEPVGVRAAGSPASICTAPFTAATLRSYGPVRLDGRRVDTLVDGGFVEPVIDVVDVPIFLTHAEVAHLASRGLRVDAPALWSTLPNVHVEAIEALDVGAASADDLRAALIGALAPGASTSPEGRQVWHVGSLVRASDRILGSRWRLPDDTVIALTEEQSRAVTVGGVRLGQPGLITPADGSEARAALRLLVEGDGLTEGQVRDAVVGLDPGPGGGPSARYTDAELLDLLVWGVAPAPLVTSNGDAAVDSGDRSDMVLTPEQIAAIVGYVRTLEPAPDDRVERCRPIEPGD